MWKLDNRTPFKAERTWVQDPDGGQRWVVVVKGTFDILPDGSTKVADEQADPVLVPEYYGEDGVTSLRYEGDLIPAKPGTDVYVNGHAHAPGGKPTTRMTVGLRIADRPVKALQVVGDRTFGNELGQAVPSAPLPFTTLPLQYERAYGGFDNDEPDPSKQKMFAPNPVGTGVATSQGKLFGKPAPNISSPGGSNDAAHGFGAVCSYWEPRSRFAGTYDGRWVKERKPLLPDDYDPRFQMCAPADQQFVPHLRGGEPIEIANMTPSGRLAFSIPKLFVSLSTSFATRDKPKAHPARLNTVVVEPDVPRVMLVWHGSLRCHREADFLDETVIALREYQPK